MPGGGEIMSGGPRRHEKEKDSPLFTLDNRVLADHTGYSTEEPIAELKTKCAWNVRLVLESGKPPYQVNRL